ncbi:MAG TPA: tryptophan synthase subunit beta, partial [Desulfobulbaceae bacterium]|nr:tryptophan synthase subunit beta [Desulfobulbaceae bacterium]
MNENTIRKGYYGPWGGAFIPEVLHQTFAGLNLAYESARADESFWREYVRLMGNYSCRPTPLTYAENLSNLFGGARIFIKREDLNHTGAHKVNNTLGQCLLTRRMGKPRVIAETGAGQHGVATATAAALMGLECAIFMGVEDIRRQALNVYKMRLLGAEVVPVAEGTGTLADAVTAALRHWVDRVDDTFYVIGSVVGPHPYPAMVAHFQRVIGAEALVQLRAKGVERLDAVVACVGGG